MRKNRSHHQAPRKPKPAKTTAKTTARTTLGPGALGLGVAALAAVPSAHAASFNVTNLNDSGAGSLRQAILDANGAAGADVITFQSGLSGTITLTTGQLEIYDSVDIQGPGAPALTVDGNNAGRVFYLYNSSGTSDVRIAGLTIAHGSAYDGAGIASFYDNLMLEAVTITQNQATFGGGVAAIADGNTVTIHNSTIDNNDALDEGGGIALISTGAVPTDVFTLDTVQLTNNHSGDDSGGMLADGFGMVLTIVDSVITGNSTDDDGGAIYIEDTGGPTNILRTVISGNTALERGGAIYLYDPDDDVIIQDSTISGNSAGQGGGGLFLYSFDGVGHELIVENSTISGNSATRGGGIYLYYDDHGLTIRNSTISNNQATTGEGGGINTYFVGSEVVTFDFTTVSGNTAATEGGGIYLYGGTMPVTNSIVGDNTAAVSGNDLAGDGDFDVSFSLIESPAGATINDLGNNQLGVDPQLTPLANNGGLTETQRPALTSPAIDAGDPGTAVATDQRGQPRPNPVVPDMGALEIVGGTIQFDPDTYSVAETGGFATLTVTRDIGPDPATIDFTTNDGTANAGADYTTTTGTSTFAPGDLSETITVPILDDTALEGNEDFTATLSNPSGGAVLGVADTATVTILDDPPGTAQFSVASINTTEDAGTATLTVTRTGGTEGPLTVNYATADGTATAPDDYIAASGSVTFPAGDSTPQTITITLINDFVQEDEEMFDVTLTGPGVGSPVTVSVVLAASDPPPIPTVSLLGKILLALLSGLAGLYAIVRSRFSMVLFALLLTGLAAGPALHARPAKTGKEKATAAWRAREGKNKVRGTLTSITMSDTSVVVHFSDGQSVTVPLENLRIVDRRSGKRAKGRMDMLDSMPAGTNVVVKLETDASGKVTRAKIKFMP